MGIAGAGAGFIGGKALQFLLENKTPSVFSFEAPASIKLKDSGFVVTWLKRGDDGKLVGRARNIDFADIFQRVQDTLIIHCRKVRVNGINIIDSELILTSDSATFNGTTIARGSISKSEGDIYGITTPAKSRLGFGDVKLMALAGAFVGWPGAFFIVLLSFICVLAFTIAKGFTNKPVVKVAFAPYITFAAVCWILYAQPIRSPLLNLHF